MAENTKIEWTHHTFNPWWGCSKVHEGCTHCYAEAFSKRTGRAKWGVGGTRVKTSLNYWRQPIKWNREAEQAGERRRVFCASMADVFEDWDGEVTLTGDDLTMTCPKCGLSQGMPIIQAQLGPPKDQCPACKATMTEPTLDGLRWLLFRLIDATPWLDWLLLTKRPENIRRMWTPIVCESENWFFDPAEQKRRGLTHAGPHKSTLSRGNCRRNNVWLGTSVSSQDSADGIEPLLACRDLSPVLFLSAEPLVGQIDLRHARVDWVIAGGESGPGARPCNVEWIRSIVEQCQTSGVSAFVKQLGSNVEVRNDECSEWLDECGISLGDIDTGGVVMQGDPVRVRLADKKGGDPSEWPSDLRVRQFPATEAATA